MTPPGPSHAAIQASMTLTGKVLRRDEAESDRSSNGSSFHERRKALYLYDDGTFRLEVSSSSRVSAAGMSFSSGGRPHVTEGDWTVRGAPNGTHLVLRQEGVDIADWVTTSGDNVQYLDGEPWNRYRITR